MPLIQAWKIILLSQELQIKQSQHKRSIFEKRGSYEKASYFFLISAIEALSRNESPGILKDCYDDPGQFALIEYLYYYKCDGCEKIRFYYGEGEKKSCFYQWRIVGVSWIIDIIFHFRLYLLFG